ncbi:hypothetical protein CLOM_g23033 [Closterium sp. NIES-68]|nr:hypothetical protein CLOM_g23033 [Closterium sp. NIES-68]GJP73327.1 hypothetical protein CLOP_g4056 [Closterium sp. NIES-67]GJP78902.1 hypothetical protein CLOP_g9165 [Closterium sp. NIES-67]
MAHRASSASSGAGEPRVWAPRRSQRVDQRPGFASAAAAAATPSAAGRSSNVRPVRPAGSPAAAPAEGHSVTSRTPAQHRRSLAEIAAASSCGSRPAPGGGMTAVVGEASLTAQVADNLALPPHGVASAASSLNGGDGGGSAVGAGRAGGGGVGGEAGSAWGVQYHAGPSRAAADWPAIATASHEFVEGAAASESSEVPVARDMESGKEGGDPHWVEGHRHQQQQQQQQLLEQQHRHQQQVMEEQQPPPPPPHQQLARQHRQQQEQQEQEQQQQQLLLQQQQHQQSLHLHQQQRQQRQQQNIGARQSNADDHLHPSQPRSQSQSQQQRQHVAMADDQDSVDSHEESFAQVAPPVAREQVSQSNSVVDGRRGGGWGAGGRGVEFRGHVQTRSARSGRGRGSVGREGGVAISGVGVVRGVGAGPGGAGVWAVAEGDGSRAGYWAGPHGEGGGGLGERGPGISSAMGVPAPAAPVLSQGSSLGSGHDAGAGAGAHKRQRGRRSAPAPAMAEVHMAADAGGRVGDSDEVSIGSMNACSSGARSAGGGGARSGGGRGRGQEDREIDALGRCMTKILRHQASQLGIHVAPDGFVLVVDLLRLPVNTNAHRPLASHTLEDVRKAVARDNKQRFTLKEGPDGEAYVRANQGHSLHVDEEQLLQRVTNPAVLPECVHGTYERHLPSILASGLSRMNRQHVHLTKGVPSHHNAVVSGFRANAEVLVVVDVARAMADGMSFFQSDNGVILSSGFDGCIPPKYFSSILKWPSLLSHPLSPLSPPPFPTPVPPATSAAACVGEAVGPFIDSIQGGLGVFTPVPPATSAAACVGEAVGPFLDLNQGGLGVNTRVPPAASAAVCVGEASVRSDGGGMGDEGGAGTAESGRGEVGGSNEDEEMVG